MAVQGLVRLRKHQLARQFEFGNKVAATRAYPFSGTPDVDLAWTDPEVDAGSRDPSAPPFRGPADLTFGPEVPALGYNTATAIFSAFFGNDETPSGAGTAKTWSWTPSSTTVEDPDPYTYEFGDDVLTDWYQFGDCILESFEITGPEGLGPLTATLSWRMGSMSSTGSTDSPVEGTVPTPALAVDTNEILIYLKDMAIYIASDDEDLTDTNFKISDALHTFVLRGNQEIDQKRYANQTQTFDISAYGPGTRGIELECSFAKTADTVGTGSESDAWMSDTAVNRYVRLHFLSTAEAQTGIFYSLDIRMPMRYYTREEGEIGNNTIVVLTGHAFYDPVDFAGVFSATLVNTLTDAQLGLATS